MIVQSALKKAKPGEKWEADGGGLSFKKDDKGYVHFYENDKKPKNICGIALVVCDWKRAQ
jgi:hypothetical protein